MSRSLSAPNEVKERKPAEKVSKLLEETLRDDIFYIDPCILPKGGTMLFGGQAKIGKSMIMLELARALATGTRPFDSSIFTVPKKVNVLLIEQELGKNELKKRLSHVLARHKFVQYDETLHYLTAVPDMQLSQQDGVIYLRQEIERVQPQVVILDPISMFHGFDENSNTDIGELFRRIEKIKESVPHLELSFILSHHFKKPSTSNWSKPDHLNPYNFSGSQRWFNTPDTLVTFHRKTTLPDKSGWFLDSRWIPRRGKQLDDITFLVKPEDEDCQVRVYSGGGDKDGVKEESKLPFLKLHDENKKRKKDKEID